MPYLYGENRRELRREMKAHLEECPECRDRLSQLQTSKGRLDAWKLPKLSTHRSWALKLSWAMTGLVLVCAGFAAGRFSGTGTDPAQLQARIEAGVQTKLAKELKPLVAEEVKQASEETLLTAGHQTERLIAAFVTTLQAQRNEDRRAIEAAFQRLESQRVTDLASLKQELDTLAVNTDLGLRHTRAGLVELANYRALGGNSEPLQKTTQ
jgi:hypothetical protein